MSGLKDFSLDGSLDQLQKQFPKTDIAILRQLQSLLTHSVRRAKAGTEFRGDHLFTEFITANMQKLTETVAEQTLAIFGEAQEKVSKIVTPVQVYRDVYFELCHTLVYDRFCLSELEEMSRLYAGDGREFYGMAQQYKPHPQLPDDKHSPTINDEALACEDIFQMIDYLPLRDLFVSTIFTQDVEERGFILNGTKMQFVGFSDRTKVSEGTFTDETDYLSVFITECLEKHTQPDPPTLGLLGVLASIKASGRRFVAVVSPGMLEINVII